MTYYRMKSTYGYPDAWYLGDINTKNNWIFTKGVELDLSQFSNLTIEIDQEGIELDYTTTDAYGVPIVSKEMAECLFGYMNDIQLIPVSVPNARNDYFILVAKNKPDCVDRERAEFTLFEEGNDIRPDRVGDFEMIDVLRLDKSKIDKDIFRIAGFTVLLIVSEKVKLELEKKELTALTFELVE